MNQQEILIYCMKLVTLLGKYDGKIHCFTSSLLYDRIA
jgi:hypothetical protein